MSRTKFTLGLVFVLAFLSQFTYYGMEIPLLRIVENSICTRVAHNNGTAPNLCKSPQVQNELAYFFGILTSLNSLMALSVSLWFGSLADQYGRRFVLAAACTGEIPNLVWVVYCAIKDGVPLGVAYIAAAFMLIGGGKFMFSGMLYTVIVDVAPQSSQGLYLCLIHGLIQFVGLWATNAGAKLSTIGPIFPFVIIVIVQALRLGVIFFLPETSPSLSGKRVDRNSTDDQTNGSNLDQRGSRPISPISLQSEGRQATRFWASYRTLIMQPGILFCCTAFLFKRIGFSTERLIFQYVSEILETGLENTGWAQVAQGTSATIVTVVVFPMIQKSIQSPKRIVSGKHISLIRGNLLIATVGFTTLWLASTKPWFVLGMVVCGCAETLEPCLQAFAAAVIDPSLHARLFATLGLLDTLARLVAGPVNAMLYAVRDSQGKSRGWCFLSASLLFLTLFIFSWTGSIKKSAKQDVHSEREEINHSTEPEVGRRLLDQDQAY